MARGIPARLTPPEGRKFGLTVGAAFLVLAGVMVWRRQATLAWGLGLAGFSLVTAAVVIPGRLGPVHRVWMGLSIAISKVTTPIFMGVVYFVVLMPVGLVMRLFGRNPVRHRLVNASYWASRNDARGSMNNQF